MIKVENVTVHNLARAIYSARNAMNSWDKSDSDLENDVIGENDLELAKRLVKSGSPHRKFLRQIFVTMDITAPLYFWRQFDTYKIGTVANSTSTMHTLHKRDLTLDDFSTDGMDDMDMMRLERVIKEINDNRQMYVKSKEKIYWRGMVMLLPSCFNQMRTVSMNYEVALNIYNQRKGHKLTEWEQFRQAVELLPYMKELIE